MTAGYDKTSIKDSTACTFYTTGSGKLITTTGIYYDTLTNAVSCDSLVMYDLTIHLVDDSIFQAGPKLTSYDTWASHQWVDCNNGYAPITGETSKDYTFTASGSYAVIVTRFI